MYIDTRLNKANWGTGIRNVLYPIFAHLPRVPNEDEVSPNKLYPVIAFRNLQTANVGEN